MWHPRAFRPLFAFILLTQTSNAILVNQTIDDGLGDWLTGLQVQYLPSAEVWKSQDTRYNCFITPDRTKAYNNTRNSATSPMFANITATFTFRGTAIYIYFIVFNDPVSAGIISDVDCDFIMDGQLIENYTHPRWFD
ncbi:hypothetical protein BD779DRAFT_1475158 [Infundibulicybe gibba]|nr:hypothetical protein BD779DRAFT_1475158 [Infundibulicybe gibba]